MSRAKSTYFFPHIPKTGGTTILAHLNKNMSQTSICNYGVWSRIPRFFKKQKQIEDLGSSEREAFDFIQGHGLSENSLKLFPSQKVELMTVLRDPISHIESSFNHFYTQHKSRGLDVDTKQYLNARPANIQCQSIVNQWPSLVDTSQDSLSARAISVLEKFNFVFFTETLDRDIVPLLELKNLPLKMERKRVVKHEQKQRLDCSVSDLTARNSQDIEMYAEIKRIRNSAPLKRNHIEFNDLIHAQINIENEKINGYSILSNALCNNLQGEAAIYLMGASADVNWIDKEVFLPMLESDWNSKIKKLNVKQREIAENKTVDWVRQQFIKKIKS